MDRFRTPRWTPPPSFPRRRGDGPRTDEARGALRWFPPQARGWTPFTPSAWTSNPVSPAGAGMDPEIRLHRVPDHRFPRRARGWTRSEKRLSADRIVSPAGAGMDPMSRETTRNGSGFPRRRGDGPREELKSVHGLQFPPQARGWTGGASGGLPLIGVSPAGAGMDLFPGVPLSEIVGFPRRRGDGPWETDVDAEIL